MDKIVRLRNYNDHKIEVSIPNWEDVRNIIVITLSGDELLYVSYNGHESMLYDSDEDDRMTDYFDGVYDLPINLIDKFSEFEGSSYECMEYIKRLSK